MEAVLALRNAIDSVGVNLLGEFLAELSPLGAPVDKLLRGHPPQRPYAGNARKGTQPWN